jgi:hypothetical protein
MLHERLRQSDAPGFLGDEYEIDVGQAHAAVVLRSEHAREAQLGETLPARRGLDITGRATAIATEVSSLTTGSVPSNSVTAALIAAALRRRA